MKQKIKINRYLLNQYVLPLWGSTASNHPPPNETVDEFELDLSRVEDGFCEDVVDVKLPVGDGALWG